MYAVGAHLGVEDHFRRFRFFPWRALAVISRSVFTLVPWAGFEPPGTRGRNPPLCELQGRWVSTLKTNRYGVQCVRNAPPLRKFCILEANPAQCVLLDAHATFP